MLKKTFMIVTALLAVLLLSVGCTSPDTVTEIPAVTLPVETPVLPEAAPALESPTSKPEVTIFYSPSFVLQSGVGHVLIVNISIHNEGYEEFDTSPELFSAVVSNKPYKYDPALSNLRPLTLPDGGKNIGMLSFPVPAGTSSNNVGFKMTYSGTRLYNITWFERD